MNNSCARTTGIFAAAVIIVLLLAAAFFTVLSQAQMHDHDRLVCATYKGWPAVGLRGFVSFSEDETMVATFLNETEHKGHFVIYEVPTCNALHKIEVNTRDEGWNRHFAFSYDGRYFAYGTTRRVYIRDLTTGRDIVDIRNLRARFLQFTPDGSKLIAKQLDAEGEWIYIFPMQDFSQWKKFEVESLLGKESGVNSDWYEDHDVSPDGKYMAITFSGGGLSLKPYEEYGELHVYDLETQSPVCITDQLHVALSIDWSVDGSQLLMIGADGTPSFDYKNILIIDPLTCEVVTRWEHPDEERSISNGHFLDDNTIVVSRGAYRLVDVAGYEIWDIPTKSLKERIELFYTDSSGEKKNYGSGFLEVSSKGSYFAVARLSADRESEPDLVLLRWNAPAPPAPLTLPGSIADQSYPRAAPITSITFPEAVGGVEPITYMLAPALPQGLIFNPVTRTLNGTPTEVTSSAIQYAYIATDATNTSVSLHFSILVYSPVSIEDAPQREGLHVYPNPVVNHVRFTQAGRLSLFNLLGRQVLDVQVDSDVDVSMDNLSAGIYLYHFTSEDKITSGKLVKQ